MTDIDLKFSPENDDLVLAGKKCATTRDEPKGVPGDEFVRRGVRFRLLDVRAEGHADIIERYYRIEGFDDEVAFYRALSRIYPDRPSWTTLYVHFFARCGS